MRGLAIAHRASRTRASVVVHTLVEDWRDADRNRHNGLADIASRGDSWQVRKPEFVLFGLCADRPAENPAQVHYAVADGGVRQGRVAVPNDGLQFQASDSREDDVEILAELRITIVLQGVVLLLHRQESVGEDSKSFFLGS